MYAYPPPSDLAYPARVLSGEGALLEAILKWDRARAWPGRGNPSRPDAAPGDVPRKHGLGRPWVSVRPLKGVCHLSWLDGDRRAARNRQEPSPRKRGPRFLRRR